MARADGHSLHRLRPTLPVRHSSVEHRRQNRASFSLNVFLFFTDTGTPLTVTLAGSSQFTGLLVQAVTATGGAAAGSFAAPAGYQAVSGCPGGLAGTNFLTHTTKCAFAAYRIQRCRLDAFQFVSIATFHHISFAGHPRAALRSPSRGRLPPRVRAVSFSRPRSCRTRSAIAKSLPAPSPRM